MFYRIPLGICLFCVFWKRIHLGFYGKCQKMRQQTLTGPCPVVLLAELTLPQNNVFLFDAHSVVWRTEKCMLVIKEREGWRRKWTPHLRNFRIFFDWHEARWKEGGSFCFCKADRCTMNLIVLGNSKKQRKEKGGSQFISTGVKRVIISAAPY